MRKPDVMLLCRAVHMEGTQSLQLLLKPDMTYFKDHRGRTVLQHAAEKGSMAACELILRMRADAVYDTDKMVGQWDSEWLRGTLEQLLNN